jgi:tRNA-2-methylthio-N6-dimethylallyladenosine synthase
MNVADSERLAGILETELGLIKVDAHQSDDAHVVLFNTCSIRDHAEQKLYTALGPYRARKRNGDTRLAIIVTGCVAQQEGYNLLRKIPEIDVVLGPQYVPFLANVLEQIEWGHQLVVTAPMLIPDNYSSDNNNSNKPQGLKHDVAENDDFSVKPIRGHTVRAWVNVIYGCNEHCTYCV